MVDPPIDYGALDEGRHVNYWDVNPVLQEEAKRRYPDDEFEWAEEKLQEFGRLVGHTIADNADRIDSHGPTLQTHDKYGELLNRVEYHPDQFENERLIYEHGIVADAFEAPDGRDEPVGLLHTLTEQLLLSYADTGLVCAQSMTSGAALTLRNHDHTGEYTEYLNRLTSRDYESAIEGAMFLTEEQGGSDVGSAETVSEPAMAPRQATESSAPQAKATQDGGELQTREYELTGEKWFCSNIDAQATLALGRRPGAPDGTKGLSLFLVPHELPSGELNDQRYRRLKDKLGTESVPTGEVEFDGTTGYLVGEPERGFKYMTTMLNWERVTNAVGAVGIIGRLLLESTVKAANRDAFGQAIQDFPLMQRDLVEMAVDHEATLTFAMEAAHWLDRYERDHDDDDAFQLMRLLVPVSKHVTTRTAVDTASYAMEIQGGNGYVEDFVTHRLYRDAQALPIWEGTANILSLDVLRAMEKEAAHEALLPLVSGYLDDVEHPYLQALATTVQGEFERLQEALLGLATADDASAQYAAKEVTEYIYEVTTASILLSRAQDHLDDGDARKAIVANLFVERELASDSSGVRTDGTPAMEYFDAIVRYASLDATELPDQPVTT
ncbi:Acyl-CoA dehydrogenase [Halanaeroarchaeum sp. HSR-CO]|uniref:acyl-CoA dehydrogenase family protein n=1 Tax=Halanaeroarchaeum sp. HSR-CO TaxID=2866382 RepID=UPI00217D2E23|nr:acyl-CoA dehydrogenase family protein [Halanaeroarchaeum sp. HSR-CO]UWG47018.1 Acyl-CoA dehydrogenase [Halanaeroarchaeum sp. HSR-CO]